jgi:hypothetical protein
MRRRLVADVSGRFELDLGDGSDDEEGEGQKGIMRSHLRIGAEQSRPSGQD